MLSKKNQRLKFYNFFNNTARFFFLMMLCLSIFIGFFVILPKNIYYENYSFIKFFKYIIAFYLVINTSGSYFLCILNKSFWSSDENFDESKTEYSYCLKCQMKKVKNVHHCILCNKCIERRDHHCFFMKTCIGKKNHKFFILFCLYTSLAGIFSLNEIFVYFRREIVSFETKMSLIIIIVCICGLIGTIISMSFLIWQTLILLTGKTSKQLKKLPYLERFNCSLYGSYSINLNIIFQDIKFSDLIFPLKFYLKK